MAFGALTKAVDDEKFYVVIDKIRKLYEVRYPTSDDTRLSAEIANANQADGVEYGISGSEKRVAKLVCDEFERTPHFKGFRHVVSVMAAEPEFVDSASDDWSKGK